MPAAARAKRLWRPRVRLQLPAPARALRRDSYNNAYNYLSVFYIGGPPLGCPAPAPRARSARRLRAAPNNGARACLHGVELGAPHTLGAQLSSANVVDTFSSTAWHALHLKLDLGSAHLCALHFERKSARAARAQGPRAIQIQANTLM